MRGVVIAGLVGLLAGCRFGFDQSAIDATSRDGRSDDASAFDGGSDTAPADASDDAPVVDLAVTDMMASACPGNYVDVGVGSRYRLITTTDDWILLEAACEADGQHLVVLDSLAEANAVISLAGGADTWVGVTDRIVELEWRSVTNVLPTFLPWSPTPTISIDNCVDWEVGANTFDNQSCDSSRQGICECDGLPVVAGTY